MFVVLCILKFLVVWYNNYIKENKLIEDVGSGFINFLVFDLS